MPLGCPQVAASTHHFSLLNFPAATLQGPVALWLLTCRIVGEIKDCACELSFKITTLMSLEENLKAGNKDLNVNGIKPCPQDLFFSFFGNSSF